jgi:hypothetical protein
MEACYWNEVYDKDVVIGLWIEFLRLRIGLVAGLCEHVNERVP